MADSPDPAPRHTEAHILSKWRLIAWYWAAQALFVGIVAPLWIMQGETVGSEHPLGRWKWESAARLFVAWDYWASILGLIAALMALQAMLIWPVRRPRARTSGGWPVWLSLGTAALLGSALAIALAFGLSTIAQINEDFDPNWTWEKRRALLIAWGVVCYVIGGILLYAYASRRLRAGDRHESIFARIAATLFTGTLIEAAAIMPIDIMFRRRQDCYCLAGTFWAYTLLIGAGLITLGPAILLPILMRRRKRWYASRCDCCGYDMTGLLHADRNIGRCPECGAGWKADRLG